MAQIMFGRTATTIAEQVLLSAYWGSQRKHNRIYYMLPTASVATLIPFSYYPCFSDLVLELNVNYGCSGWVADTTIDSIINSPASIKYIKTSLSSLYFLWEINYSFFVLKSAINNILYLSLPRAFRIYPSYIR